MTVSVNNTADLGCVSIRVTSDLYQTFFDAGDGALTLEYTVDCGDPITIEFSLTEAVLVEDNMTYYDVLPTEDDATKMCDGIYCFKLTYAPAESMSKVIQYGAAFVSCDTECKISDKFALDRSNAPMVLYYDVIKLAMTCDSCDCSKACAMYSELKSILDGIVNLVDIKKFIKVKDCGCSKSK